MTRQRCELTLRKAAILLVLVALVAHIAGCATYRAACLPDSTFTIGRVGSFGVEGRTLTRSEVVVLEMEDQASFGSVTKAALTGIGFLVVFLGDLFVSHLPSD